MCRSERLGGLLQGHALREQHQHLAFGRRNMEPSHEQFGRERRSIAELPREHGGASCKGGS